MATTSITGDGPHAVAFKLMEKIIISESNETHPERKTEPRKYYTDLYRECLDAITAYKV